MRVLVFGATGDQGAAQIRRLRFHGHEPVAAVRETARETGQAQGPTNTHTGRDRGQAQDPTNIRTARAGYTEPETPARAIESAHIDYNRPETLAHTIESAHADYAEPETLARTTESARTDYTEPEMPARAIESVHADYAEPETLARAVAAVRPDAVFLTLPSTSFQAAAPLIQAAEDIARAAAQQSETRLLVFNASMIIQHEPLGFAAHDARHEMRRRIMAAAPAVSIAPVIYLDNLLRAWAAPSILEEGVIRYPHAETLDVSWITQEDVADLMIAAMSRPALAGRSFTVGGPEAVRGPDLARRLGAAIGRRLQFDSEPVAVFAARMAGLFEGAASLERERLASELARIYTWYNTAPERPFHVDMTPVLEALPVTLTSIETWARRWIPVRPTA